MSSWSLEELEHMDEKQWRLYIAMRFDTLEGGKIDAEQIEQRCAARRWHGPAIKAILGGMFTAMLGIVGWLLVKVFG